MTKIDKWTLVQHSGYGYGSDSQFMRAVETRHVGMVGEARKVELAGGVLFDSYTEACDAEEKINGVTGERPFLNVAGDFSDKQVDNLAIYIPVREVVG